MALVTKILEQTLAAGSTAVTFTDSDIPNSLIRVFSSNPDIIPVSRNLVNNTLTVTYEAQAAALDVAVEIVKQGLDIVDNVLSEDTDKALSAKQGYLLSAAIGDVSDGLSTLSETVNNLDIPDNITDLDDVTVTNIQSGQVLAWDGTKFVNVDQSGGGGSINYSTQEQDTGIKWIDNNPIYQKTIVTPALNISANSSTSVSLSSLGLTGYDTIIDINGKNDTLKLPLPYIVWSSNTLYALTVSYDGSSNLLFSRSGGGINNQVYTVTIRYTKI